MNDIKSNRFTDGKIEKKYEQNNDNCRFCQL